MYYMAVINDYMRFLLNKTEGEVVGAVVDVLKDAGFAELEPGTRLRSFGATGISSVLPSLATRRMFSGWLRPTLMRHALT